ncbi:MAG: efflux RND transporter periplasmic adaptor subunit [Polyangiales bacterium]
MALGLVALVGCDRLRARAPEPLQGVIEHDDYVLGFEIPGRVAAVEIDRGDRVTPGEILVRLDDGLERPGRDARASDLEGARAQLSLLEAGSRAEDIRSTQAQLVAAAEQTRILESQFERQRGLVATGAMRLVELEQLETSLANARGQKDSLEQRLALLRRGPRAQEIEAAAARVQSAEAALAQIDARLARYVLRASEPGHVIDVHVHAGEYVSPGSPGATIADLDHPFVDVFVPEGELDGIHVGSTAQVNVDATRTSFRGRVEHVFPKAEFTPRFLFSEDERPNLVIRVRIRLEDPRHQLHAGVPAFATIDGARRNRR